MKLNLRAFGIAKDIIGGTHLVFDLKEGENISALKTALCATFPHFEKLVKFSFAVDEEFQDEDFILTENQEVVILPPSSGG